MQRHILLFRATALAWALALTGTAVQAGEGPGGYPQRPVKLIVPFLAGGATDLMARSLADKLSHEIGQPVVVDNRAGAGGALGAEVVATAPRDGYTLLYSTMGVLTINPSLYSRLKYDPVASFAPVALTHVTSNLLVVNPSVPARSVGELVALARSKPGELAFSSAGNGTSSHLSGELFQSMARVDLQHVPYKGTAAATSDLLAGRVAMTLDTTSNFVEYVKAGKLRALAVTSRGRTPALPDVPSMSELPGFADFDVSLWCGVLSPAGTPEAIVKFLNQATVKVMSDPAMKAYLAPFGIVPLHSSPREFADTIEKDRRKWAALVKSSGAQMD